LIDFLCYRRDCQDGADRVSDDRNILTVAMSRNVNGVRDVFEACGREQDLPPSISPDHSPIEQIFAKLKSLLRMLAAWSGAAPWSAIGRDFSEFLRCRLCKPMQPAASRSD
jgi:hypothetical protein